MLTKHHCWYPRRDYTTALERKFRNLPCNIVLLEDDIHRLLHEYQEPPRKPSAKEMRQAIEQHRRLPCKSPTGTS